MIILEAINMWRRKIFSIVCLLAGLVLMWLGAKGNIWPGDKVQSDELQEMDNRASVSSEDSDILGNTILQVFTDQGGTAEVEQVRWGSEELPDRLWEQMEQWREDYADKPFKYAGYIELLGEPSGKEEEGFLREYATVQYLNFQETFLVTDEGIYEIRSRGDHDTWQSCMQELLCSVPQWQITGEEAEQYVHEIDFEWRERYNMNPPANRLGLWYQGIEFSFYDETLRLLAYRSGRGDEAEQEAVSGRECLWFKQMRNGQEEEWRICTTEALPVAETYRELREYLQGLYPDMRDCEIYTQEEGEYTSEPLIGLLTNEAEYGYYCQEGQWYQICIKGGPEQSGDSYYHLSVSDPCYDRKYSYLASYWYLVSARGNVTERDLIRNSSYFEEEISPGQTFSFDCRVKEINWGELFTDLIYEVAVSIPGEEEPFQIFEAYSTKQGPFSFEDFNADGFLDLRVDYYYGTNGGTASHYIWSPSGEKFVEGPEELEYYGMYGIDQEKRQLSIHYHGSAISGAEALYQWSGEMDWELIRYFDYEDVYDYDKLEYIGMQIDIRSYENGQEKILSDYLYPMDEYTNVFWVIYCLDFVWEQEMVLDGQEGTCILRYAQEKEELEYLDYIFLFREDTYLICTLEGEAPAAYADIIWNKEAQQLVVEYVDGTAQCYQWNGEELLFNSQSL